MLKRGWMVPLMMVLVLGFAGGAGASPFEYGDKPYVKIRLGGETTYDYDYLNHERDDTWQWWPGAPIVGTSYGMGNMAASNGSGTVKAETVLNYHDPFESGQLSIGSDVQTWNWITVASDVLDIGEQVTIYIDLHYSGTLQLTEEIVGLSSFVRVSGLTTIYDSDGDVVDSRSGVARVESGWVGEDVFYTPTATDAWSGSLASTDTAGWYTLNYTDTLTINALVGDTFWMYFDLALSSTSTTGSGAGWDGSRTYAAAMFGQTATYSFWSDNEQVMFQSGAPVPEPGTIALLGIGLAGLFALRKRFGIGK